MTRVSTVFAVLAAALALALISTRPLSGESDATTKPAASDATSAPANDLTDPVRLAKADVVLRVTTKGPEKWLVTYNKVTFKVLDAIKAGKHEIGTGKLTKDGEFWMAYIVRKTDKPLPGGEMTLYLTYKEEHMQAGMGPVRTSYSVEFLGNTPEKAVSHVKGADAATSEPTSTSKPASEPS